MTTTTSTAHHAQTGTIVRTLDGQAIGRVYPAGVSFGFVGRLSRSQVGTEVYGTTARAADALRDLHAAR